MGFNLDFIFLALTCCAQFVVVCTDFIECCEGQGALCSSKIA